MAGPIASARARVVLCALLLCAAAACVEALLPASVSAQDARGHAAPRRRHARRAPRPHVSASYRRMRARWHQPASPRERDAWESSLPRPPLVLVTVGAGIRVELLPERDDGGFGADALLRAEEALAARRSGARHPIDAGVLDRVYRAQRHFRVPFVWVVSGFREDRATSRHTLGRAMDIVLPGVRDTVLADHLRAEGFSGVGTYSLSGFVHVDVRNRSYFWIDGTSPGRRSRARGVLGARASGADARALARGVPPPFPPNGAADDTDDDEAAIDTPEALDETASASPPDAGLPVPP
jgi:hypothetical protein